MKKLLAVAIAATMSATAMADLSISGKANFEYTSTKTKVDNAKTSVNGTETEINLNVLGQSGDTQVVLNLEIDSAGTAGADNDGVLDIEDSYITTKVGPVDAKLGNYAPGNDSVGGEIILSSNRRDDRMELSYSTNGVKLYAGNDGSQGDDSAIAAEVFAGVIATVEGWKLQAKRINGAANTFGVSGTAGPIGVRAEYVKGKDTNTIKAKKSTGYFVNLTGAFDNVNLGVAMTKVKEDGGISEDDSSIYAVSNDAGTTAGVLDGNFGNSNMQLHASIAVDGTTYGAKVGKIGFENDNLTATKTKQDDRSYYEITASRALASGVTAKLSYEDEETGNDADKQTFEIDLSVAF